jgi:hypothetical protein
MFNIKSLNARFSGSISIDSFEDTRDLPNLLNIKWFTLCRNTKKSKNQLQETPNQAEESEQQKQTQEKVKRLKQQEDASKRKSQSNWINRVSQLLRGNQLIVGQSYWLYWL